MLSVDWPLPLFPWPFPPLSGEGDGDEAGEASAPEALPVVLSLLLFADLDAVSPDLSLLVVVELVLVSSPVLPFPAPLEFASPELASLLLSLLALSVAFLSPLPVVVVFAFPDELLLLLLSAAFFPLPPTVA